jgi:hypothetical protein
VGAAVAASAADAEQSNGRTASAAAGVKGQGPAASLLGMTVSMQRIDVPAILEQLKTKSHHDAAGAAASSGSKSPDHGPPPSKSQRTDLTSGFVELDHGVLMSAYEVVTPAYGRSMSGCYVCREGS